MSEWTLAGAPVLGANLSVPATGPWVLDADLDTETAPAGAVELVVGGATWRGAVEAGGVFEGRWRGRVVGGAGGLSRVVAARYYRSVPARLVVGDLVADAGERLAADAPGLDTILAAWVRRRERAREGLSRLCAALGLAWRVGADGIVTTSPWPASEPPDTAGGLGVDPGSGIVTFGAEDLAILPGTVLVAGIARAVVYRLEGAAMRCDVELARA